MRDQTNRTKHDPRPVLQLNEDIGSLSFCNANPWNMLTMTREEEYTYGKDSIRKAGKTRDRKSVV